MSEIPVTNPEKRELLEDNARKFVLGAEDISPAFLEQREATAFTLISSWLEIREGYEKKLAHKTFTNGKVQILLVEKFGEGNNRATPPKKEITQAEYEKYLIDTPAVLRIEKNRHEFVYEQSGVRFAMKYDEFAGSALRMLEVDAEDKDEEKRKAFDFGAFARELSIELTEVTGQMEYYGHRIAGVIRPLGSS